METQSKYFVTDLVAEVGSLPTLAAQVVSLTANPECDLGELSRLILSDNVLTMRFLALANSAAVSHGQEVKNLRGALVRLGIRRVRNVALLMGMHDMTPTKGTASGLDMTEFWKHCLAVASCAQGLAWQKGLSTHEDAWLVGILHGLGVNAMAQRTGAEFASVVEFARHHSVTLTDAEMRVLEFHHGELGARILKEWKLPRVFAEVVEFYPEPFGDDEVSPAARELIEILLAAIEIARTIGFGDSGDHTPTVPLNEMASRLKLERLALEALAVKVDREVQEMSELVGMSLPDNLFANALQASQQEVARVGLEGFDDTLVKEDLEAQMAAARDIQQRILPHHVPSIPGFELAAANYPSKAVSGDTYDFITLQDGSRALVIADVSGKGIPAALLAATLQASLRALALVFNDPGDLLAAANRALFDSTDPERFATLFIAVLAPDGASFRYASAGHNPPLLRRAHGDQVWLKPAGTPLGMLPEMTYPVTEVALESGDLLVTYTDGITEATDDHDIEFEEKGLLEVIVTQAHNPPAVIIEQVIGAVHRHVVRKPAGAADADLDDDPGNPPDAGDDLTMVVLKKC